MTIGLAVGLAGTAALVRLHAPRRASRARASIRSERSRRRESSTGSRPSPHGSGFLAVFIAGLALGDLDIPYKRQIRRFHIALASLAEIVVFVGLGPDGERHPALRRGRLARRAPARARGRLRRSPACARAAARSDEAAARREGLHRLGRAQGSRSDPARRVLHPRGRGGCATHLRDRVRRRALLRDRPGRRACRSLAARLGVPMRSTSS